VELIVLGAGPAFTDRLGSAGAAYLVRTDEAGILLDLGQGAFPRLMAAIEPSSLAGVLISHLHPDHFIDLVPLRHYLRYQLSPRRRVRIVGPAGLRDRLDALHGEPGFCAEALDVEALMGRTRVPVGPFDVEVAEVSHSGDSHAFRIATDGGTGLVYSGDCASTDDLAPLIRPGDTLLVEVSFGDGGIPTGAMHLDAAMVAELVGRTRPGRVLLTHLLSGSDRAATVARVQDGYPGLVELVEPGFRAIVA
jgi:ribonuclease BN (tRNA processing enzyme)